MNYIIEIFDISPSDAIDIKQSLVNVYQMRQEKDFTWEWHQTEVDPSGWTKIKAAHARFCFATESNAMFFKLKYLK